MTEAPEPPVSFAPEEQERIRAHVRARGMAFEVFLPETLANWLRERISAGVYKDPGEAAFVAFQGLQELGRHPEVRKQLLAAMLDAGRSGLESGETMTLEEWRARHQAKLKEWARTEPPGPRPIPTAPACDEDGRKLPCGRAESYLSCRRLRAACIAPARSASAPCVNGSPCVCR